MPRHIDQRADFELIRYANCWEDADILCEALRPAPGKRILSIASAGDNALALLAQGAEVIAVDLSPAQLACVELRCAGFRHLSYEQLLALLGLRPSSRRKATYAQIAGDLSMASRKFWDKHPEWIEAGVIHAGKFENYFQKFRTWIIPCIHRRGTVAKLLAEKSELERHAFYEKTWDTLRWRLLFRLFFNRFVMARLGRDPEFFRYVKGSVADRILLRTRHALTKLSTHGNPYLHYILTGNFGQALPRYLRPEYFEAIRDGLDRLTLVQGPIERAAEIYGEAGFDGYNLSDIFEYLAPTICRETYEPLLRHANPGARMAYWNMLVPRKCPDDLADRVEHLQELSQRLFDQDMAFFYSAFVIEEVH